VSATSITLIVTVVSSPIWVPLVEYFRNKLWAKFSFHGWQAVFMNDPKGTITYFGHITSITKSDLVLKDIYYLQEDITPESLEKIHKSSLVKLGEGQLHNPEDKMIINRRFVSFIENMTDEAPVVKAIIEHKGEKSKV
jgi:hypothetical protein